MSWGLLLESLSLKITIFIHVLIADVPVRAKICNMKQFNGEFECPHCLNPGTSTQRRRVYLGTKNLVKIRYTYVNWLNTWKLVANGIKGPTKLSDYGLRMPVDVVTDYMHACLEEMRKQSLKLRLKSTYSRFAYYHGPRLSQMKTILNATRYPSKFPSGDFKICSSMFHGIRNIY